MPDARGSADLKILKKQKWKRERPCEAIFSIGSICFSTGNYNDLAIASEKKNIMRPSGEVVGRHACQKCVMKKKKKYQLSFPHQKRLLAFCARCKNKATSHAEFWVLLSLFPGDHVQISRSGIS
jgi:hypothetical protein